MLAFGFTAMISIKILKAKKRDFCRFSMIFCSCANSKGDILQKEMTFLRLLNIPF